jgi:hypothetical protein
MGMKAAGRALAVEKVARLSFDQQQMMNRIPERLNAVD